MFQRYNPTRHVFHTFTQTSEEGITTRGKFVGAVTIGERGQIVVPAEARKEFGLEVGDKLLVFSRHHGIVLMKADDMMQYVERTLADLTEMQAAVNTPDDGADGGDAARPGDSGSEKTRGRKQQGGGDA